MSRRPRENLKVLIVEDVDSMRSLLEVVIGGIPGIQVSGLARNTAEARLELFRRRPDLVVLDEILPGESSLDLIVELKNQKIPVLLTTGLENPSHPLPGGVQGRFVKPSWKTVDADRARIEFMLRKCLTVVV